MKNFQWRKDPLVKNRCNLDLKSLPQDSGIYRQASISRESTKEWYYEVCLSYSVSRWDSTFGFSTSGFATSQAKAKQRALAAVIAFEANLTHTIKAYLKDTK